MAYQECMHFDGLFERNTFELQIDTNKTWRVLVHTSREDVSLLSIDSLREEKVVFDGKDPTVRKSDRENQYGVLH